MNKVFQFMGTHLDSHWMEIKHVFNLFPSRLYFILIGLKTLVTNTLSQICDLFWSKFDFLVVKETT